MTAQSETPKGLRYRGWNTTTNRITFRTLRTRRPVSGCHDCRRSTSSLKSGPRGHAVTCRVAPKHSAHASADWSGCVTGAEEFQQGGTNFAFFLALRPVRQASAIIR